MFVTPNSISHILFNIAGIWIVLIVIEVLIANIVAFGGRIPTSHPAIKLLHAIVDPVLRPIRQVLSPMKTGGWDLSPLVAILLLELIQRILISL